jgi:hypothetical protein
VDNGFNRIDAKQEIQGEAIASQGEAMARLEVQAENTAAELKRIETRLDEQAENMAAEFRRVDARMDTEFTAVRKEISEGFQRMQRLMIEVGGGIVITLLVASRLFG